jgi:hypothetical protein
MMILKNVDHLSWLGLFKDISCGTSLRPFWDKSQAIKKTDEHARIVYEKFKKIRYDCLYRAKHWCMHFVSVM